jgi:hypothetical protein
MTGCDHTRTDAILQEHQVTLLHHGIVDTMVSIDAPAAYAPRLHSCTQEEFAMVVAGLQEHRAERNMSGAAAV